MSKIDISAVEDYLRALQLRICASLEDVDGKQKFRHDHWDRSGGGGGESRVMVGGAVFEQAGVDAVPDALLGVATRVQRRHVDPNRRVVEG